MQHFEYETLAHLASDGQARDHTKTTHASVPKWTKTPRVATASKETKSSSGQVGKKRGPVGKNEDGGDKKRSKRDTKNQTQQQRLIPSPVEHNNCPKLELSGA